MTKREAQKIFEEVIALYEACMPDFKKDRISPILNFNKRTSALGTCRTTKIYGVITGCKIYLSEYAMKDAECVRNTLAHEIAHTFDGCQNHGQNFKAVGKRLEKHTGIVINTCATDEEAVVSGIQEATQLHAKYTLKCANCGKEWYYQRTCRVVKNYRNCNCPCCGTVKGKLILIEK